MAADETKEAWVELPEIEHVERVLQTARVPLALGFVPRMTRLLMAHERLSLPFRKLYKNIMIDEGRFTKAQREMIAAVSSAALDCHY